MSYNKLNKLPTEVVSGLVKLGARPSRAQQLAADLHPDEISKLRPDVFSRPNEVPPKICANLFAGLDKLQNLDLQSHKLCELPAEI